MAGKLVSKAEFSYRDAVLREMGLAPLWRLRTAVTDSAPEQDLQPRPQTAPEPTPIAEYLDEQPRRATPAPARFGRPEEIVAAPQAATAAASASATSAPSGVGAELEQRQQRIATLDWEALEADIHACRACALCEQRKQAVVGVGDHNPEWMFVGEGPGREEDLRGEPFVGQAGRLLDGMLAALGLERSHKVYIANAVKCRPPHNRIPQAEEIACCRPYLERQIELLRPQLLFALGRPAAQALLNEEVTISAVRGKVFDYGGIPLVISYHPAYLLRNPQDKGKAWDDLCFARRLLAGSESQGRPSPAF